jgi:hypothetical protein
MRAAARPEVGSRAPSERDGGEFGPKACVTSAWLCVSAATLPNVPTRVAKTSWDAAQGMFDNLPGMLVG